jgi:hypothetical protein
VSSGEGTVGTLKTGNPHIQALSQGKEQGMHPHAATKAVASDHTSLQRWAPEAPRVPRPSTSPPCRGELRCCHVARGPGPRFLAVDTLQTRYPRVQVPGQDKRRGMQITRSRVSITSA